MKNTGTPPTAYVTMWFSRAFAGRRRWGGGKVDVNDSEKVVEKIFRGITGKGGNRWMRMFISVRKREIYQVQHKRCRPSLMC